MAHPSITVAHTGAECVVTLTGEIDVAVRSDIDRVLVQALAECPDDSPVVVLDMDQVTFIDSSGLGGLVQVRNEAHARGQSTVLQGASPRIMKLLEISGLETIFEYR